MGLGLVELLAILVAETFNVYKEIRVRIGMRVDGDYFLARW